MSNESDGHFVVIELHERRFRRIAESLKTEFVVRSGIRGTVCDPERTFGRLAKQRATGEESTWFPSISPPELPPWISAAPAHYCICLCTAQYSMTVRMPSPRAMLSNALLICDRRIVFVISLSSSIWPDMYKSIIFAKSRPTIAEP